MDYQRYWRLVIAMGAREECRTTEQHSSLDFFRILNQWNSQQPGVYQYWQTAVQRI